MMTVQRDMQVASSLESLRRALASIPEGPKQQEAQQAFQRIARQVGPVQQPRDGQDGTVQAASTVVTTPATIDDPDRLYTDAVKSALIDAMIGHSLEMDLGPDEWLTVAARQSEGPLAPNQLYDVATILLRVKGSDLSIYAADRTKRAEVLQKVEVRV